MFSARTKRHGRISAGTTAADAIRGLRPRAPPRAAGLFAAGLFAVLHFGFTATAQANTCAPATVQGSAPNDYQNYCWLDFTGYSDALAQGAGQPFTFVLPDTSTLSMTVQVTTNKGNPALNAHVVPSWSGSAIGNNGFNGIPGNPVLYESQNGSTVTVVLNNITVTPPAGSGATDTYAIIAADGESTNQGESLQFTTNGSAWAQVAQIPNGGAYPTVSGVGSDTVTETGVAGTVGSFAFASFSNPTVVTAKMVGSGLQGVMFAVRYASMSVTAQFGNARANAADQFVYTIKTLGGTTLATGTTTGAGNGPFPAGEPGDDRRRLSVRGERGAGAGQRQPDRRLRAVPHLHQPGRRILDLAARQFGGQHVHLSQSAVRRRHQLPIHQHRQPHHSHDRQIRTGERQRRRSGRLQPGGHQLGSARRGGRPGAGSRGRQFQRHRRCLQRRDRRRGLPRRRPN